MSRWSSYTCALAGLLVLTVACGAPEPDAPPAVPPVSDGGAAGGDEVHLTNLRQLTFGGENAEAYFSFEGSQLIFSVDP